MTALLLALVAVPALDQGMKLLVRASVGSRALSLGRLGEVRVVQSQIWLRRGRRSTSLAALWSVWAAAAVLSTAACMLFPVLGWPLGLLLGGALSHAFETTVRGAVDDYLCLRFWPAFNLADVALTMGAAGVALVLLSSPWPWR